ncbi:uncharacterized protein EV420DRAFT_662014 [Desarmillaria tabescens]|uniref:Uncharacterized protein n=1 Tax=Armillaria tabescens TaxID=1929756 RepID=A0AA39NJZ5_ARMTA|nr:uncharacterized protein EV420DRAFT_662014 [Desarmillaria tabescens]KAK0467041.1 hypothetical protein EV420DRAFT_662014 [Desarmillaria tabescens]
MLPLLAVPCFSAFPPTYCSNTPPPHYCTDPTNGERSIEHAPHRVGRVADGTFIRNRERLTVLLTQQEDGISSPVYGRMGNIAGAVLLSSSEDIIEVKIQVKCHFIVFFSFEGRLHFMSSENGSRTVPTVSETYTLWNCSRTEIESCPGSFPFSFYLPLAFEDSGRTYPLPPTFQTAFTAVPSLVVTSVYTLIASITTVRRPLMLGFDKVSSMRVPITYYPRTRPERPPLYVPLLSSIKTCPEEWNQVLVTVKAKCSYNLLPIQCNFFVPSVQAFSFSDVIPFHIQLSGPLFSLLMLFPQRSTEYEPSISVTMHRQIIIEIQGRKSQKNQEIGVGTMWPIPPPPSQCDRDEEKSIDWGGEIRCKPTVKVGGFAASGLSVKDYILFSLEPPSNSPFLPARGHIPILLTTDSWADAPNEA